MKPPLKIGVLASSGRRNLKITPVILFIIFLSIGTANLYCQDASLTIKVTTVTYNGEFAPANAGAIWIEDATGKFVKTVQILHKST